MDEQSIDTMRRAAAALRLLVGGPTLFDSLDPAKVLVGVGPAFTEEEKTDLADELDRRGRQMVYQEFGQAGGKLALGNLHVVAPNSKGVFWWDQCMMWASTPTAEVMLMPVAKDARGHFVNRGGALKYFGSRPTITHEGMLHAATRMGTIVERLTAPDYEGQSQDGLGDRGTRYWQRRGFRVREDGRTFSPEQAAAIHRFRPDGEG